MPELPEVETIKNELAPHVIGRKFTGVSIYDSRPVQALTPNEFDQRLTGKTAVSLSRRGKYLIFNLSDGEHLIIHLRMTGALLWNPLSHEPCARAEFLFDDGSRLVYADVRRFGTFYLVNNPSNIIGKLGLEPLSREFTSAALGRILATHNAPVKSVILNQELIAGIGNMYADEALFDSHIHPRRPASSLSKTEVRDLHKAIRIVLRKGIRNKGASIRNYRCPDGGQGTAHEEFCVAHRGGEPCPRCGTQISRIVVGQRGTYFCPRCQAHK